MGGFFCLSGGGPHLGQLPFPCKVSVPSCSPVRHSLGMRPVLGLEGGSWDTSSLFEDSS